MIDPFVSRSTKAERKTRDARMRRIRWAVAGGGALAAFVGVIAFFTLFSGKPNAGDEKRTPEVVDSQA